VDRIGSVSGSPFAAFNCQFREDVDYEGIYVLQAGWQWKNMNSHLFRVGAQFFTGKSEQLQFLEQNEEKVGVGIWYDY
jgi:hypothetical protein